ncbi:MAG: hypothetical protein ACOCUT_03110, partial [bacterium]
PFKKQSDNQETDDNGNIIRPLRTYKDDVASLVKDQQLSTSKIMLAEQKRRQSEQLNETETEDKSKSKSTILKVFFTVLFVVLGVSAIFYVIQNDLVPDQIKNIANLNNEKNEIIRKESESDISIGIKTNAEVRQEIIRNIEGLEIDEDSVEEIVISKTLYDEEDNSYQERITANDFLNIIDTNTSDRLERTLNDRFLFGLYKNETNTPFIILKTDEADIAFAEFYDWENQMYYDLREIMRLKDIPSEESRGESENSMATSTENATTTSATSTSTSTATSTATSTNETPEREPGFNPRDFKDLLIMNRDVRAIIDDEENIILMYSFIDSENILITKDRETFREIIDRISSQRLLR